MPKFLKSVVMCKKQPKILGLLICLLVNLLGMAQNAVLPPTKVLHKILVQHPGIHLKDSIPQILVEIKNESGQSDMFYMEVETVVCGDAQCKIDTIQIFWNHLGFYSHMALPKKVQLEKAAGKHFTKADYDKLDQILSNKNASLKDVYKEEVVGTETSDGIDGISGATITLNTKDYVSGAVWTCYTLWHWANGGIFEKIRNITATHLRTEALTNLFSNGNEKEKVFALEQIIRRKVYQPREISEIIKNAPINNYQCLKLTVDYFEAAPLSVYSKSIATLLNEGTQPQQLRYLKSISKTEYTLSITFFERVSTLLPKWDSYPLVNQCLNILEQKKAVSPTILSTTLSLLSHKNFLIARRAYWFLAQQQLSTQELILLNDFYTKNKEKL